MRILKKGLGGLFQSDPFFQPALLALILHSHITDQTNN